MRLVGSLIILLLIVTIPTACSGGSRQPAFVLRHEMQASEAPGAPTNNDMEHWSPISTDNGALPITGGESGAMTELLVGSVDSFELSAGESEDVAEEADLIGNLARGAAESQALAPRPDAPATGASLAGEDLVPQGWPEYVPIMEGFSVRYGGSDVNGMRVRATGSAPLVEVKEFYMGLEEWRVGTESNLDSEVRQSDDTETYASIFIMTRGDESLHVAIYEADGVTTLQLFYSRI